MFLKAISSIAVLCLLASKPSTQTIDEKLIELGKQVKAYEELGLRLKQRSHISPYIKSYERELTGKGLDRPAGEPWPPAEPILDPAAFRERMRDVPHLGSGDFLRGLGAVDLDFVYTGEILEPFGGEMLARMGSLDALRREVVEAVTEAGYALDPKADVKLELSLRIWQMGVGRTLSSQVVANDRIYFTRADAALVVPARFLRDGEVHCGRLEPANSWYVEAWNELPDAERIQWTLREVLSYFKPPPGWNGEPESGERPWRAWIDAGQDLEARHAAFYGARTSTAAELDAGLEHVAGFSGITHRLKGDELSKADRALFLSNRGGMPSGKFERLYGQPLVQLWQEELGKRGLPFAGSAGMPVLDLAVAFQPLRVIEHDFLAWFSTTKIAERDALAFLDGRYVRLDGDSYVARSLVDLVGTTKGQKDPGLSDLLDMLLRPHRGDKGLMDLSLFTDDLFRYRYSKEVLDLFVALQAPVLQKVAVAAGAGGSLQPAPPMWGERGLLKPFEIDPTTALASTHPDALGIANYLKSRERVPVPDAVLAQVSDMVAQVLAEYEGDVPAKSRFKWRGEQNGKPFHRLYNYGARDEWGEIAWEAKNRVEWLDPVAMAAFDNPFGGNTEYEYGDHPQPPEFVDRLGRARPAGGGALAGEELSNGYKLALDLVDWYAPEGTERDYKKLLKTAREKLERHPVLIAHYTPTDGKATGRRKIHFFWYGATPEEWPSLMRKLPRGLPFHRIGPGRSAAPDRLDTAEALIDAGR